MKALPFPCIRPIPEIASQVAAPPYDVFDRTQAAAYAADRPLSFLNIDRPETQFPPEQDMYAPEVYARGAALLRGRLDDGTFMIDGNRAYYIYELAWQNHMQTGITAVCPIDEYENGAIKRHELTRADKERDRIEHIRALGCQTGPILLTYRDQPVLDMIVGAAKTSTPLYAFTDDEGVRQTIWEVTRHDAVDAIHAMLGAVPCAYIADGHHRAASAIEVGRAMKEEAKEAGTYTGKEPFNFLLSVLFPASQLTVLPYNRVVADRNGLDGPTLIKAIRDAGFEVAVAAGPVEPRKRGTLGLFTAGSWFELKSPQAGFDPVAPSEGEPPSPIDALDVSILQNHILEPILGIEDPRTDARISFVGGVCGADELERRAGAQGVAFTLNATGIDELMAVADAGLVMPPKSTWFEPKLRSGLFIHRIAR